MLSHIKKDLKHYICNTSIKGIARMTRAQLTINKMLWLISTIIASLVAFTLLKTLLCSFLNHDVITRMSLKYDFSTFPDITVCFPWPDMETNTSGVPQMLQNITHASDEEMDERYLQILELMNLTEQFSFKIGILISFFM